MKRTINGVICDTATAKEISVGGHGLSPAWWGLYETPDGHLFRVSVDNTGAITEWYILSAEMARDAAVMTASYLGGNTFHSIGNAGPDGCLLTLCVPAPLAHRIEAVAAAQGVNVKGFVMHSLETALGREASRL